MHSFHIFVISEQIIEIQLVLDSSIFYLSLLVIIFIKLAYRKGVVLLTKPPS